MIAIYIMFLTYLLDYLKKVFSAYVCIRQIGKWLTNNIYSYKITIFLGLVFQQQRTFHGDFSNNLIVNETTSSKTRRKTIPNHATHIVCVDCKHIIKICCMQCNLVVFFLYQNGNHYIVKRNLIMPIKLDKWW